jgi:hypothetical protein
MKLLIIILLVGSTSVGFQRDAQKHLNLFKKNPYKALNQIPKKKKTQNLPFPSWLLEKNRFVQLKDQTRKKIVGDTQNAFAPILSADRVENLVEFIDIHKSLDALEDHGLTQARVKGSPWSGYYWALYKGSLGHRYEDPEFYSEHWYDNYEYILANPLTSILNMGSAEKIDQLSPAEKYDLLFSMDQTPLTDRM